MDCREVRERLSEYIDEVLDRGTASRIGRHLEGCADCTDVYASMTNLIGHMREMDVVDEPADLLDNVKTRLDSRFSWDRLWRRLFSPPAVKLPIGAAAAALVALLIVNLPGLRDGGVVYEITFTMDADDQRAEKRGKGPGQQRREKKGVTGEDRITDIVASLDGTVVSSEYGEAGRRLTALTVEIPAENFRNLLQALDELGEVTRTDPAETPEKNGRVSVRLLWK